MTESSLSKIEPSKINESLICNIAILLNEIMEENAREPNKKTNDSFKCKRPPSISLEEYLKRIIKYTGMEESTLMVALIYLDRVCDTNGIALDNYTIHRYF